MSWSDECARILEQAAQLVVRLVLGTAVDEVAAERGLPAASPHDDEVLEHAEVGIDALDLAVLGQHEDAVA